MAAPNSQSSIIAINDIKALWRIVVKNWFIVPIFLAVSYIIFVFYSYRLTDIYSAETSILLKSLDEYTPQSVITDNSMGYSYAGTYKTYMDNANEMRVIKSYDLVQKAIKKIKLDVSYFIEGRVRITEVYQGTPFKVEVLNINQGMYEREFKLKILNPTQYSLTYLKAGQQVTKAYNFDLEIVEPTFRLKVDKTGEINNRTIKSLGTINYMFKVHSLGTLVAQFMAGLDVVNPDFTNIMQVTCEDVIPERGKEFLDTLSHVYIENTLEQSLEVNANTLLYIDREMAEVVKIINGLQDTLQSYRDKKGILNLEIEEREYFSKLSNYDNQKTACELKIKALDDLEDYIIQNKDPEFLPPDIYVAGDDNYLNRNVSVLYNMQIGRNTALSQATESNLGIQLMDQKIELTKKDLLVYIGNSRLATKNKIKDVEDEIDKYTGSIKTIPLKQRGLTDIQREASVNEGLYVFLLQKRASTVIARASIIPLTKIVETSRSMGVTKPNKQRIMFFFLGGGLIIALILIFIRILFYEKVESIEELKAKTDLPILGEILFNSKMKELTIPVETDPRSPITESFRTIRTNLQYMAPEAYSKIIVVTSNNPGEGKTFCSINLAAILAKAGKKVLLLELDLHKPRIQRGLNMTSEIGISTILINKNNVKECVLPSEIENLSVILSGPIPPNASELILSERLVEIFQYGRDHFDYVIVDTPPVGLISDALVMMRNADASLFVLNTKFAYRDAIGNAHELVALNKLKNFGFILNGVKRKKSKYYYNKYAYGYGYGYGYGGRYGSGSGYSGYGSYGGYGGYGDSPPKK